MKRLAFLVASCVFGIVLGCGGGEAEKKSRPEPAVLTNPIRFGTSDPVQALHWLINAYQPVLMVPVTNAERHKSEERRWKEKVEKLRGTHVTWSMAAGKLSEGKIVPRRISHPYDESTLLHDPDLPGADPMFALEPMTASMPPAETFEVKGLPEWLQQVAVGSPILLDGVVHSVAVDLNSAGGKTRLRFSVLLTDAVAKQP